MSEQNNSSDVDVDGIEATREGTKQPSNQEGSILQACREEWGGGGGAVRRGRAHHPPPPPPPPPRDGCALTSSLTHRPQRFTFSFLFLFFSKVIICIYKSGSTTLRVSFHSFQNWYFNSE